MHLQDGGVRSSQLIRVSDLKPSFWPRLKPASPHGAKYLANPITDNDGENLNVYVFKDENNNIHLIIHLEDSDTKKLTDLKVEGLSCGIRVYPFPDGASSRCIDLELRNDFYLNQFNTLAKEICDQLCEKGSSRIRKVNRVLTTWKYFWREIPSELLSKEKQLGLLCELLFLERLLTHDPTDALSGWLGPEDASHDFVMPGGHVEVKSTLSERRIHTVNGIDQLDIPDGSSLDVLSFMASTSNEESALSLQSQIETISETLRDNLDDLDAFYSKLQNVGYYRQHANEYDSLKFFIRSPILINIGSDFPCIKRSVLSDKIIARISGLKYRLNFEDIKGLELDSIDIKKFFLLDS